MSSELGGNTWQQFMSQARSRFAEPVPLECQGRLTRLTGMVLEASGLRVPVGAQCHIHTGSLHDLDRGGVLHGAGPTGHVRDRVTSGRPAASACRVRP